MTAARCGNIALEDKVFRAHSPMATLAVSGFFTFLDLCGVTANKQKLPIVCLRIEPFLSLDHNGQDFRRTRFGFKLFSHDHRPFRINQWLTLRKGGAGDVIQVDGPKDGFMSVRLIFPGFSLPWSLFTDITDVSRKKGSTTGGYPINGHDNWLHVGFTPGTVRGNLLQRHGFF